MNFSIRQATADDAVQLADFRVLLFQSVNEILEENEARDAWHLFETSFRRAITEGSHIAWLVETDGKAVACGGANFFEKLPTPVNPSGKSLYVMNMFTLPEYRGHGSATLILEAAKEFARSHGIRRVFLDSSAAGREVYRKAGFWEQEDVAMEIFV